MFKHEANPTNALARDSKSTESQIRVLSLNELDHISGGLIASLINFMR